MTRQTLIFKFPEDGRLEMLVLYSELCVLPLWVTSTLFAQGIVLPLVETLSSLVLFI